MAKIFHEHSTRSARVDLAFLLAFFVLWSICAKVFWHSPLNDLLLSALGRAWSDLLLYAINAAVWLGFALVYLKSIGCDDLLSCLKLKPYVARGLVIGALVGSGFLVKDLVRVWLFEQRTPDLDGLAVGFFVAPFVEEVVFRGCVLQRATRYTGFWRANLLSSALFLAIHLPGWGFAGFPAAGALLSALAFVFALSLLLGYLLKRTQSLWSCVVVHTASNYGATF